MNPDGPSIATRAARGEHLCQILLRDDEKHSRKALVMGGLCQWRRSRQRTWVHTHAATEMVCNSSQRLASHRSTRA